MQESIKCPFCKHVAPPASSGECPDCTRQIAEENSQLDQELQFYCRTCDDFFFHHRDENGLEQARCPNCDEWCFTPEFEVGEALRVQSENGVGISILLKVLIMLFTSGAIWSLLNFLLANG